MKIVVPPGFPASFVAGLLGVNLVLAVSLTPTWKGAEAASPAGPPEDPLEVEQHDTGDSGLDLDEHCRSRSLEEDTLYDISGTPLSELVVTLEDHGLSDWTLPISATHTAGRPFGWRHAVFEPARMVFHGGQDIGCARGEPILAAADGVVTISMYSKTAGEYVSIEHLGEDGEKLETRYIHLSRRLADKGDRVNAGQVIGRCGGTGVASSTHLHFEVLVEGKRVQPFRHPRTSTLGCPDPRLPRSPARAG